MRIKYDAHSIYSSLYLCNQCCNFFTGTLLQQLKDSCKESTNGDPEGMFEAADINDLASMQTNIGNVKMCWCMQHNMVVLYEDVVSVP